MGKKSEKIVKTPVIVESTESKVIDQVVEQVVEQVVVDAEVNMDPQFLMQELKKVPLEGVVKNTYEALKALKKLDAPQRVFVLKYEKEVERLKNNSSSILSKRKSTAEKKGMTIEEYSATVKPTKKAEYLFPIDEILAYPRAKAEGVLDGTSPDEMLYALQLESEYKRYKHNEATKKCLEKKKVK
jgi:hypothetical protein